MGNNFRSYIRGGIEMKGEKVIKWNNVELEDRDIIVTRKGDAYIKSGKYLLGKYGFFDESYDGNLIDKEGVKDLDVMEVYSVGAFGLGLNELLTTSILRKVFTPVWKREEE